MVVKAHSLKGDNTVTLKAVTVKSIKMSLYYNKYSPNGRFLEQETFPKTLPRFVLILISLQRW